MRDQWLYAILIALLCLLGLLYPSVGWLGKHILFRSGTDASEVQQLTLRVQSLEAERATLHTLQDSVVYDKGKPAFIFSNYPFNAKQEVVVSIGAADGISVGDVALVPTNATDGQPTGVLLGKVTRTFDHTSVVQTVFDSKFEMAVRIGDRSVDALLKGGSTPHITLIPRRSMVQKGDIVYSASQSLPYGLALGSIDELAPAKDTALDEATLVLGYDISRLQAIIILSPRSM
jgi:cell shape-determining protein MreC